MKTSINQPINSCTPEKIFVRSLPAFHATQMMENRNYTEKMMSAQAFTTRLWESITD
ncbi:hypothetical protein [Nostoc linckia]|uniref:hypothetical protein n=1 Tax=Nostoc linckia TaxID=92942 RepID=UPI0015D4FF52|nr:hypothetical protein [Nostoc linckia]